MKSISLSEFSDYCANQSFHKFIYASANQPWHSVDSTTSAVLAFEKIIITFNPNIIHLFNGKNTLNLIKVKAVRLLDKESMLGKIFTVICGDLMNDANDKEYILIAR